MLEIDSRLRRRLLSWRDTFFSLIVIGGGVLGLILFSFKVARRDAESAASNFPGAGIVVRSELVHLWLPQTLLELARGDSRSSMVRTHADLRRWLESDGRKDLWYAITTRGYQVNGELREGTVIRWPYNDATHFAELLDTLATADESPPRSFGPDNAKPRIHILPEELLEHDPRAVMADLLRNFPTDTGREDSP